jgi:hypothetical protein
MRKIAIILLVLIFMSFKNYKPLQDKLKIVLLTTGDWNSLQKISTKGKNTVAVVDFKTRLNVVSTVQYQNESIEISKTQRKKLNEILKKYD